MSSYFIGVIIAFIICAVNLYRVMIDGNSTDWNKKYSLVKILVAPFFSWIYIIILCMAVFALFIYDEVIIKK